MICIVGGGIAGLYAALQCAEKYPNRPIEVHEASGRWGGHIQTYYGSDYRYETGPGRFNSNHRLLTALIRRFGLTPQPIQGKKHYCERATASEKEAKPTPTPTRAKEAEPTLDDIQKRPKGTLTERQGMTFGAYIERHYSPAVRHELQAAFGYDAEFDVMNAADALRLFQTDFRSNIAYFSLKEGLSALVERIVAALSALPQVKLVLRSAVRAWEWRAEQKCFHLTFQNGTVRESRVLFLAIPKKALMEMEWPKTAVVQDALNGVVAVPLHRLYGKFYADSLYPMERQTTANRIRQYIPVNPAKRIAMVSYCDTKAADAWKRLYDADPVECKKRMESALTRMERTCGGAKTTPNGGAKTTPIGEVKTTPIRLRWLRSYYWPEGVHVWRPGVSSRVLGDRLRHPLGAKVPCYIVGESFSALQGWIEGALWTVQRVLSKR